MGMLPRQAQPLSVTINHHHHHHHQPLAGKTDFAPMLQPRGDGNQWNTPSSYSYPDGVHMDLPRAAAESRAHRDAAQDAHLDNALKRLTDLIEDGPAVPTSQASSRSVHQQPRGPASTPPST